MTEVMLVLWAHWARRKADREGQQTFERASESRWEVYDADGEVSVRAGAMRRRKKGTNRKSERRTARKPSLRPPNAPESVPLCLRCSVEHPGRPQWWTRRLVELLWLVERARRKRALSTPRGGRWRREKLAWSLLVRPSGSSEQQERKRRRRRRG